MFPKEILCEFTHISPKARRGFFLQILFAVSLIQIPAHAAGIVNASIRGDKDGFDIVQRFNECQTVV